MKGILKRIAPFFITLAVGLFIASFFVSVALPSFKFNRSTRRQHREYDRQLRMEVQQLREENVRLKREAQSGRGNFSGSGTFEMNKDGSVRRVERMEMTLDADDVNGLVPPPPPMPPRAVR